MRLTVLNYAVLIIAFLPLGDISIPVFHFSSRRKVVFQVRKYLSPNYVALPIFRNL